MLGDLFRDALSLPFKALKLPATLVSAIAAQLDPGDDAAIRSAARDLARATNAPFDVCLTAIRDALD